MEILEILFREIKGFLGINGVLEILKTGNYEAFLTYDGIISILSPMVPFLLIIELIIGLVNKNSQMKVYKSTFLIYVLNRFISVVISIGVIGFVIAHLQKYAPFQANITWYWLIYGYIVWEFSHFIYHYLAHKVRLFWCLHSTHHSPEDMNLSVSHAHFFLEGPYADLIRTSICIIAGLQPNLLFLIMFIDGFWGALIHVGENLSSKGKLGFLHNIILTPLHHRIHHARNPLYMDTNYCNLLNLWDKIFGTYQLENPDIKIEFGITRPLNTNNVLDVYFGEFYLLFLDIIKADGIKNKLLYVVMPPGWSHNGNHKTAKIARNEFLRNQL